MSTQEEAREAMVEERQHTEQVRQTLLNRSWEEIETSVETSIQAEARDRMVAQRQHEKHTQDSLLSRSASEVGVPQDSQ
jgi:alpha-glucuronidase